MTNRNSASDDTIRHALLNGANAFEAETKPLRVQAKVDQLEDRPEVKPILDDIAAVLHALRSAADSAVTTPDQARKLMKHAHALLNKLAARIRRPRG